MSNAMGLQMPFDPPAIKGAYTYKEFIVGASGISPATVFPKKAQFGWLTIEVATPFVMSGTSNPNQVGLYLSDRSNPFVDTSVLNETSIIAVGSTETLLKNKNVTFKSGMQSCPRQFIEYEVWARELDSSEFDVGLELEPRETDKYSNFKVIHPFANPSYMFYIKSENVITTMGTLKLMIYTIQF